MRRRRAEQFGQRVPSGGSAARVVVTTSWDDGHILDLAVAEALDSFALPGTFYIAPRNVELPARERLGDRGTRALAEQYEIGGHTLHHLRLPVLPAQRAREEIRAGKSALEDTVGRPLRSFCYPGGWYLPEHVRMVDEAGFAVGRTVERLRTDPTPALEMATSVHCYRHLVDGPAALRLTAGRLTLAAGLFAHWDRLAMHLFDQVLGTGGVFHLWGHSWEIERNGDWDRLTRVLAYIARRPGVRYVDNGGLAGTLADHVPGLAVSAAPS